ncbi:unnamed protein product [Prunus armeniaca]
MQVDSKPFPPPVINMVNAQLWAEYRESAQTAKEQKEGRRAISTDYEEFGGQYNRRPTRRAVFDRLGAQSPSTSAGHKDEAAPRPVKTFKPPVVRDDRWYHAQLGGSTEPLTKTQLRGMQRQVQQARIQTVQVEGLKRQKKMATADEPPSVPIVPPTSSLQGRGALGRTVVPAE